MHLRLLGTTYYDLEVERYIQLRSMEWEAFPGVRHKGFCASRDVLDSVVAAHPHTTLDERRTGAPSETMSPVPN